jgi:antibiotic biosynthesis monooxygenase (ABM) superfamily enzyme
MSTIASMQPILSETPANDPLTITITRTVLPGREEAFESKVKEFIPKSLAFPGHLGVHVVKPSGSHLRDYVVVIKFKSREQWRAFRDWPEYASFRASIEPLMVREPAIQELSGLESWFTLPSDGALQPLPRWKMAIVTLLAVYPTSLAIQLLLGSWLQEMHITLRTLTVTTLMVAMLTWYVMPLVTRVFRGWLYGRDSRTDSDV